MPRLHKPRFAGRWIDLGSEVAITRPAQVKVDAVGTTELRSFWSHKRPDGTNCGLGQVSFAVHVLESREPLTIGGSFLCQGCGKHGHVRDGRWVPA